MNWEPAERVQKNDAGEYRALIGGQWTLVERAQKNDAGEYRVIKFAKPEDQTPSTSQMASVATGPEVIAGSAPTRWALGAADPLFAVGQAADWARKKLGLPDWLKPELARARERIEPMVSAGRKEIGSDGVDWARLGGNVTSPVSLAAAKAPMAVGLRDRVVQGAKIGGVLSVSMPVENTEDNFVVQKASQAAGGAAAGGAVSAIAPVVIKAAGAAWDILIGKFGQVQASKLVRDAAGGDLAAIKAVTAAAPDDITAAQATAGLKNDVWDALAELARANDKTSYYSRLAALQQEGRVDALRQLAGGPTQTEARRVAEESGKALRRTTEPMLQTELEAANTAGRMLPRLQGQADQLGAGASSKVEDVRRLVGAGQKAEELAHSGAMRLGRDMVPPTPGLPRAPERYAYGTELAQRADDLATLAAKDSLVLGEGRRFAQMQADSLSAHGLKPLDSGKITASLRAKINNPSIGVEDLNRRVLNRVAMKIDDWTDRGGGIIDARALYEIRKSAVNSEVDRLLGPADPVTKAKRAAKLLSEVKPLIDDAFIEAGGTGWRNYLNTFERGSRVIERMRLGAKALDMLESSPKKFLSLVRGNEPREVEKIFSRQYDIESAMGQRGYSTLRGVAEQLERDMSILEGAARGQGGLKRLLDEHNVNFILPNWIDREIAVTNRVIKAIESRIKKSTTEALYEGLRTGKRASELLNTIPTEERLEVLKAILPYARSGASVAAGER